MRGVNYRAGYGTGKPYTSVLPYLRAKEAAEKKVEREKKAQSTNTGGNEESFPEAIHKIVSGEEQSCGEK